MSMKLSPNLLEEMRRGHIVLFLGAGASVGGVHPKGERMPIGDGLAKMISERFLGGRHSDQPLAKVAELAQAVSDLVTVQTFIHNVFIDFMPAEFHLKIPTFRWRAIFTTNYDTIIENAYASQQKRVQTLTPFLSNEQKVDDLSRSPDDLLLYKLHGSITRFDDNFLPMILTPDQYVQYRDRRSRLFDGLINIGHERSIIFIGHEVYDSDIRIILNELDKDDTARPMYYLIKPKIDDIEHQFWASKRITCYSATFAEFLETLSQEIPENLRAVLSYASYEHPIQSKFVTHQELSTNAAKFLKDEIIYIHNGLDADDGTPNQFYRGFDLGWYPILYQLDVRRSVTDTVLAECIIIADEDRPVDIDFYIIKGEAGAGKSIFLRRLAWEAATDWDKLCIYLKDYGRLNFEAIHEIYRLTQQRIFLFVDDAASFNSEIDGILGYARRHKIPVTIISTARFHEWNILCSNIAPFLSRDYKLHYLSSVEVEKLLSLLEEHQSLGNLKGLARDKQIAEFEERAGRQLLVALHEATSGRRFEDILIDEYNSIRSLQAQSIYLVICVLHRLGVEVRAGIIFRIFGIPFPEFEDKFFAPLEQVVKVKFHPPTGDYHYTARHPEIAAIVFNRILTDAADRFDEYIRVLNVLNISYESDSSAYQQMIRARNVLELFPDYDTGKEIYKVAEHVAPQDYYRLHQQAIFEMNRPNANMEEAETLLHKALAFSRGGYKHTVKHSLAELGRKRALSAQTKIQSNMYRSNAEKILGELLINGRNSSYPRHTLIKLALDELQELLSEDEPAEIEIEKATRKVERQLGRALQEFPDDPIFSVAEADYRKLLEDDSKVKAALENAFEKNSRNVYVACRLSRIHEEQGNLPEAQRVLRKALESNRNDNSLNLQLAMTMIAQPGYDVETVLYHLRRSFTQGDKNYNAQFWYARYLYERGGSENLEKSKEIFRMLRAVPMEHTTKTRVRSELEVESGFQKFRGLVVRLEETFGYIERDGAGAEVFMHRDHISLEVWKRLYKGAIVEFSIGFNFSGPICTRLNLA